MKTLTVRQPWALALAMGWKPAENRTWTTTYTGPLALHAAATWDDDPEDALRFVRDRLREQGIEVPKTMADLLPWSGTGLVIAVAELDEIPPRCGATCEHGPWAIPGHYHWPIDAPVLLDEPIPARGRLGLWDCEVSSC